MPQHPNSNSNSPSDPFMDRLQRHEDRITLLENVLKSCPNVDPEVHVALGHITMEIGRQIEDLHDRVTQTGGRSSQNLSDVALFCADAIDKLEEKVAPTDDNLAGEIEQLRESVYEKLSQLLKTNDAVEQEASLAAQVANYAGPQPVFLPGPSLN